jgi:dUTP pyrophosphatase
MQIKMKKITPTAVTPKQQTSGSVGFDLHADIEHTHTINPGQREAIPTGIALEIPQNFEAQVRPRSGLAVRQGLTVLNAPGTIDSDYRGEIVVVLINHGVEPVAIIPKQRIAQLVFSEVPKVEIVEVGELEESERGDGGLGSTGA